MTKSRLDDLRRIATIQKKIVQLSQWQLARAERTCRVLAEDQERLRDYVVSESILGGTLARAALNGIHRIDRQLVATETERAHLQDKVNAAHRKEKALEAMTDRLAVEERRREEERDLGQMMEEWLARSDTSLP